MTNIPAIGFRLFYTVCTYDIDQHRRMTTAALVRQMQEAAMQNVMALKLSVWDMEHHHFSWVMLRKNLKINRLPMVGEKMSVVTYPAGFDRVFTYRDFWVYDEKGNLLATSATTWLLMNTETRAMVRIPAFVLEYEPQIPPPEKCLPRAEVQLPPMTKTDAVLNFRTDYYDLDFNGHLNNIFYNQWMLETLPGHILEKGKLNKLDIQYKVEVHWRDEVVSEMQILGKGCFLHRLKRKKDGKELAVARSEFL